MPLPEAAISVGSAVPGWLRPRGSWAVHRGPAGAPVARCQTAAWVPSSGPRGWSSSPQPAAAAAACSSQTHTGSTPLSPLPVRRRGTERDREGQRGTERQRDRPVRAGRDLPTQLGFPPTPGQRSSCLTRSHRPVARGRRGEPRVTRTAFPRQGSLGPQRPPGCVQQSLAPRREVRGAKDGRGQGRGPLQAQGRVRSPKPQASRWARESEPARVVAGVCGSAGARSPPSTARALGLRRSAQQRRLAPPSG